MEQYLMNVYPPSRNFYAGVAELVDAQVLGTCVPSDVWVRVPPPARALKVTISGLSCHSLQISWRVS